MTTWPSMNRRFTNPPFTIRRFTTRPFTIRASTTTETAPAPEAAPTTETPR